MHTSKSALAGKHAANFAAQKVLRERLKGVRFRFLTGDTSKVLLGRSSYANKLSAITVGHRHVHLVKKQHGLFQMLPLLIISDISLAHIAAHD